LRPFLQEFSPRSRLVIHNDRDLFSSTLFTLATLDAILQRGSILIFDEFSNPLHEWRAFHDYSSAFRRTCKVLGAAGEYYTQVAMEIE
jgi:O-methyltransferase